MTRDSENPSKALTRFFAFLAAHVQACAPRGKRGKRVSKPKTGSSLKTCKPRDHKGQSSAKPKTEGLCIAFCLLLVLNAPDWTTWPNRCQVDFPKSKHDGKAGSITLHRYLCTSVGSRSMLESTSLAHQTAEKATMCRSIKTAGWQDFARGTVIRCSTLLMARRCAGTSCSGQSSTKSPEGSAGPLRIALSRIFWKPKSQFKKSFQAVQAAFKACSTIGNMEHHRSSRSRLSQTSIEEKTPLSFPLWSTPDETLPVYRNGVLISCMTGFLGKGPQLPEPYLLE